ncbi:MAG: tetratricopeptide repeat protein [Nitrospirae bacterium]|nr:tetratricopeptide repeat protein [Nitrospirota bacterium]
MKRFTIHDSRFTIHDSRFTIHDSRYFVYFLFIVLFLISACATAPQKTEEGKAIIEEKTVTKPPIEEQKEKTVTKEDIIPEKKTLSIEEQEKKATEIFTEILSLTDGAADRAAIIPQMEALYIRMIEDYPDVPLVEESYRNVIYMDLMEFSPPKVDRAEKLYQDFLKNYPDSSVRIPIEQTFGQFYYTNKMWDRLLKFFTPRIKRFIETGKLETPYHMFMYSEAKFYLGDLTEAVKGYKIVIAFFPNTNEGKNSENRLKEIQNLKKQAGG